MSVRKPNIPGVPKPGEDRRRFDAAVKENLETITGKRGEKIDLLNADASLDDVIAKVNEIVALLQ